MRRLTPWLVACLVTLAGPALGGATGLVLIPTTDTVPSGTYVIEPEIDAPLPDSGETRYLISAEVGVNERVETGIEHDFDPSARRHTRLNAKYVFTAAPRRGFAAAVGVSDTPIDLASEPYVVATKRIGKGRFHLGLAETTRAGEWFTGADYSPTPDLMLMADHTPGAENASSFGVAFSAAPSVNVLTGIIIPNSPSPSVFTIQITISRRYGR